MLHAAASATVGNNQLTHLPVGLQQLSNLASLHVQHNQLQQLPYGFMQLTAISSLGLGYNKLHQLPQGLLAALLGLKQLDLSGNSLDDSALQQAAAAGPAASPSTSSGLMEGTSSCTADNRPSGGDGVQGSMLGAQCSDSLGLCAPSLILPGLLFLDISDNRLQQLPGWLPASLVWLSAGHNSISQLAVELCAQLAGSLQGFELHNNQLTSLPGQFRGFSKLQLLTLAGNPGLHPDVVDRGAGVSWAYKWLAERKQADAAAALRSSQLHKHLQR